MSLRNNHIGNLTCHLNVPYGPVVREEHLTRAFREGSAANHSTSPVARMLGVAAS